jgi:hypothetical protein
LSASIENRFWAKVDKRGPDECWTWTACVNLTGYGRFGEGLAHRKSWEINKGTIPKGICVLHSCDNPPCVNPAHLFLGTHLENIADRVAKGRSARHIGEMNGRAKLTLSQVQFIRAASKTASVKSLARIYGVSNWHIYRIIRGKSWGHNEQAKANGMANR